MIVLPFLLPTQCSRKSFMVIGPDLHIGAGVVWCRAPPELLRSCVGIKGAMWELLSDTELGVLFALIIHHPPWLPAGDSGLG